ncbi:MAG: cupredoxin family protein [Gammaproteobacteria bacterium]|nr:cupredoxin family protein [Gammaproteobacteria bacterium]
MKFVTATIVLAVFSTTLMASGTHSHSHDEAKYSVGEPGKGHPDRVITVSMRDTMRFVFDPDLGELRHGETIEFNVRNDGQIQHEFSIGNAEDQARHAIMMQKMPNMKHNDPNTVSLLPGESARLSWKFMGKDTVVFACNIPGHFEAGMKHVLAIKGGSSEDMAAN